MTARFHNDQAAGLRRLLGGTSASPESGRTTVIHGSARSGRTGAVVNLASALAHSGKDVLILDEHHGGAAAAMGRKSRFDLLQAVRGEVALSDVLIQACESVTILPAANCVAALARLDASERDWLARCMVALLRRHDMVLIDGGDRPQSFGRAAEEVLITLAPSASSVTEAYALIKRLNRSDRHARFRVLVNRASSEDEAHAVFDNIAAVAQHYLDASLEFSGWIPHDVQLQRAAQLGRPVVQAFPDAASAACFRRLAGVAAGWRERREEPAGAGGKIDHLIRSSMIARTTMAAFH